MYAGSLTQQPNNPATQLNDVFRDLFFTYCINFGVLFEVITLACWFFVLQFLLEFQRKFITFACFLMWLNFCSNFNEKRSILVWFLVQLPSAWRFLCFNFWLNFNEKSSILVCFLMQLFSACRIFRDLIFGETSALQKY